MPKAPTKKLGESLLASALTGRFYEPNKAAAKARAKAAKAERLELIKWLESKAAKNGAAGDLAEKLSACSPRQRCGSWACPECGLAAQRLTTMLFRRFLVGRAGGGTIYRISIVPSQLNPAVGDLETFDIANFARRLRYAFKSAKLLWVVGGVDFSLNEHKTGRYEAFWCPHFYGFTTAESAKDLKKGLKAAFPPSEAIPRPVAVKKWDGRARALRYAFKVDFKRRIGIDDAKRIIRKTREFRLCRATQNDDLRAGEKLELTLVLDQIGLAARLILANAQLRRMRGGVEISLSPKVGGGLDSEGIASKASVSPGSKAKSPESKREND